MRLSFLIGVALTLLSATARAQDRAWSRSEVEFAIEALMHAPDHGLSMHGVPEIQRLATSQNDEDAVRGVAALTNRLAAYADDQHGGRVSREARPLAWAIAPAPYDGLQELSIARTEGRFAQWVRTLAPENERYYALLERRRAYKAIADGGGWALLEAGPILRVGTSGPRVVALRARLGLEGFVASPEGAVESFDPALATTLGAYQAARGLKADGVLGAASLAALNAPVEEAIAKIDLNLERALAPAYHSADARRSQCALNGPLVLRERL